MVTIITMIGVLTSVVGGLLFMIYLAIKGEKAEEE